MNAPAQIGGNRPALITGAALLKDFAHVDTAIAALEKRGLEAPPVLEDDDDLAIVNKLVGDLRTAQQRADEIREGEKRPYLEAGRVVDAFFTGFKTRLTDLKTKLESRATRYLQKKADEERQLRVAEEARLRQESDALRRQAEEAGKSGDAVTAAVATEQAKTTANRADDAAMAQTAKPADLARTKTDAGTATLEEVWTYEIVAFAAIDLDALRPYFAQADVEKAIARFVSINKDTRPLEGVKITKTSKARLR